MKSSENRKREILEEFRICCVSDAGQFRAGINSYTNKALTQLNALDKPRIDEGKLFDSLEFWAYRQGNMLKLNDDDIKKLAHAIAQKAEEWIR